MGLQEQLDAFKAEFARTAPLGRHALYEQKIEELRGRFALEEAICTGEKAPDFTLPRADGSLVSLSGLLQVGPVILTFYRGGWCPYCNLQLRAYQAVLPQIEALGGRLVAVSPQRPNRSSRTVKKNELTFDVLSDVGNVVSRRFGLVYSLPEELRAALRAADRALPAINGDQSWELPVPATFVIAKNRRVILSYIEVDYRKRLEPNAILEELTSLGRPG